MNFKVRPGYSSVPALAFAAGCVPVSKIALMYWKYRLPWPFPEFIEPISLFLALGAAVLTVSYFSYSLVKKLLWVVAVSVWSCLAHLIVSFVPGCTWAPACL
jgi:hypothetical protein